MADALLEIRGVSKSFGGVQALRGVSFSLAAGEVHALCGENGAGKSTLTKVLSGSLRPDAGEARLAGLPLRLGHVDACEVSGVAVIHQECVAFPHLSVLDNLFLGREPRRLGGLLLDRRAMRARAAELLERLGERLDPAVPAGELPLAQRQMVALARALCRRCRLLIMDEPTSALSARETEALFRVIAQLRSEGVTILYISHRLEEVFALADRVTVLRDGCHVATRAASELDRTQLVRLMVGREARLAEAPLEPAADAAVLLEVRGLARRGAFEDVSFALRAGEILGLAGLAGAGRSEVARAIFGLEACDAGEVFVSGRRLSPLTVRAALDAGLALVPEDRQHEGLILPMTVGENLTLAVLRTLTTFGLCRRGRERELAEHWVRELGVRTAGPAAPAETLSGGNQQKLVLGKWLATRPRVLILDEPTRGVDVAAKAEIHALIRRLASEGLAVLLISSELPELLALSHRLVVLRGGRMAGALTRAQATPEKVLALALAAGPEEAGA